MLPLLEVPIIHELVKECIDGGITNVILVTSFGNNPVEDYFDSRPDLEAFLERTGKEERYKRFEEVFGKANITCVRQNKSLPYGSGSAVLAAKPWISEGEPFAVMYGDDLVLSKVSGIGQLKQLYEEKLVENPNTGGAIATQLVEKEEVVKYGMVKFKDEDEQIVDTVLEKPSVEETPSLLASYGRYIVDYEIFKHLDPNVLHNGELFFSYALDQLCNIKDVYSKSVDGKWLTTGDPLNYLKASLSFAMERDEYRDELREFLKTFQ